MTATLKDAMKLSSSIDCDLSKGDDHENSDKTVHSTVNKKSSIDVTKALLLLGFPSWSSLEEGMHNYFKNTARITC